MEYIQDKFQEVVDILVHANDVESYRDAKVICCWEDWEMVNTNLTTCTKYATTELSFELAPWVIDPPSNVAESGLDLWVAGRCDVNGCWHWRVFFLLVGTLVGVGKDSFDWWVTIEPQPGSCCCGKIGGSDEVDQPDHRVKDEGGVV